VIDPRLIDYCTTDWQKTVIQSLVQYGNATIAAKQLGRSESTIRTVHMKVRRKAARVGFASEAQLDFPVAEGFELKGYSHFTRTEAGEPIWLKTRAVEHAYWHGIQEAIESLPTPDFSGLPTPPEPQEDIIPWLQIGDAHIGMLADEHETGAAFDIKIAEEKICAAAAYLIDKAPPCKRMVINDLGDGTHYETFRAETESSGHVMDYDTRYWKMIHAYIRIIRFIIERALEKAEHVDFIANQGNHSRSNDIWIAALVSALYEHSGRVSVLRNDSPFIAYRMGKTLVLVHHGDKVKPDRLQNILSNDFALDWGETEFRYIDGGHVHSSRRLELAGCVFESWNNLAPRDKWANDGGWRSKQMMSLVLRSRRYGETGRILAPIERVRDLILARQPHYIPPERRAFTTP